MAYIGMRFPVAALIKTETENAEPEYKNGFVVGKAISANLTISRNDNPLYGDDAICEQDNGITAMQLEFGTDDLDEAAQVKLLGIVKSGDVYYDTNKPAPAVGFGYIRVRRLRGVTSYQAIWIHKIQFGIESEAGQTKGETIEWQTPTFTGRAMGLNLASTNGISFRKRATFTTEADAQTWLANIARVPGYGDPDQVVELGYGISINVWGGTMRRVDAGTEYGVNQGVWQMNYNGDIPDTIMYTFTSTGDFVNFAYYWAGESRGHSANNGIVYDTASGHEYVEIFATTDPDGSVIAEHKYVIVLYDEPAYPDYED